LCYCSCQDEKENDSPIAGNSCEDKAFDLHPVSPNSSGEGLPYAPEGWPNPGDIWGWKVLSRTNKAGYFLDRHLYPPKSLQTPSNKRHSLRTKPDIEKYIESNFPSMSIEAFFDLFSWQIPSTGKTPTKGFLHITALQFSFQPGVYFLIQFFPGFGNWLHFTLICNITFPAQETLFSLLLMISLP